MPDASALEMKTLVAFDASTGEVVSEYAYYDCGPVASLCSLGKMIALLAPLTPEGRRTALARAEVLLGVARK